MLTIRTVQEPDVPHEAAAACTETASAAQSVDAAMGHSSGQTAGFRMATAENFRLRTERGTTGEQVAAMPRQLQVKQDAIQKAVTIRDSSQTQLGIMMLHVLQRSHSLAAARPEQVCTEAHATGSTKQLRQAEDALVKRRDEPATGLRYLQENLSHTEAKSLEAKLPREVSAVAGHQFAQLDCQLSLERQVADMQDQLQQVQNQKNQLEEAASFHAADMRGQIDSLQRELAQTKIARGLNADSSTGALAVQVCSISNSELCASSALAGRNAIQEALSYCQVDLQPLETAESVMPTWRSI